MTELDDDRLADLIREAHRDTHLAVPLARVTGARPRRRPGPMLLAATAAVAALVAVVVLGMAWVMLGGAALPVEPAVPTESAAPPGKPPRPSSSATTAQGRCADYAAAELAQAGLTELPPLRFEVEPVPGRLRLLMYADDSGSTACWLGAEQHAVQVGISDLTITMRPSHPPGRLSNASSAFGSQPTAAYTFGRAPAGVTRVEVHFPGGVVREAQLDGEWYLLTGAGEESYDFSEITKIVAVTPDGPKELPVQHG
ncbi:hypothetical protein [Catellatospora citrea]|uniref:Uncharacterized protein n=1 Tax=Catellatospora citrea TaxID=53366 RepID=A0A8J3KH73_9ACTN|nr:hypothetical protein [Catellatospora citrea]RKE06265.1 hypothetical protein C8E86_1084 [Catellatospora citrea]GIG00605.1 hypothetical protein Cci01nite_56980 [Catellatospora citrea]